MEHKENSSEFIFPENNLNAQEASENVISDNKMDVTPALRQIVILKEIEDNLIDQDPEVYKDYKIVLKIDNLQAENNENNLKNSSRRKKPSIFIQNIFMTEGNEKINNNKSPADADGKNENNDVSKKLEVLEVPLRLDKDQNLADGRRRSSLLGSFADGSRRSSIFANFPDVRHAAIFQQFKKKKKHVSYGCLMNDGVRKVDFVLVYDKKSHDDAKHQQKRDFLHENLKKSGLELEMEQVHEFGKHLVFVKIHAPWSVLCAVAEKIKLSMPLWIHDAPLLQKHSAVTRFWRRLWECGCCQGHVDKKRKRLASNEVHITLPFVEKNIDSYAIVEKENFFSNKDRIEIVWDILENIRTDETDDKKCGIERLLEKKIYLTAYPLHQGRFECNSNDDAQKYTTRQKLTRYWAAWGAMFKPQPLERVRQYLGEKIGFYFAFMDFYTKMLVFPTIMGVIAFIYGLTEGLDVEAEHVCDHHHPPGSWYFCPVCKPPDCEPWLIAHEGCAKFQWDFRLDNPGTMLLSLFTMLWGIIFLKLWKRRESTLAVEWDTEHVEEEDDGMRPGYAKRAPEIRKNPITLSPEPHMPLHVRAPRLAFSILVTILILILDGGCIIILLICRIALYGSFRRIGGFIGEKGVEYARWVIHGVLFIVIQFYEKIYHFIAHKLTDFEVPQTNGKFMNSLMWKLFIFQMLNEFVIIIYPAFLKGRTIRTPLDLDWISELCDGSCTSEVTELLSILLLLRMVVGNFVEIGIPLLRNRLWRIRANKVQEHNKQPQWLRDFHLIPVELDGVYEEYMEMMIQFGFVMLFIAAFPLTALVCLMNNILEIRIDSIKILRTHRRPVPIRVSGISTWNRFLEIILKLAVITNAAFLAFTSDLSNRLYYRFAVSKTGTLDGYAGFGLSSINIKDWHGVNEEILEHNITKCYYGDLRYNVYPYNLRPAFWELMVMRLIIFVAYILVFYGIMWAINTWVDDVPEDVIIASKRRKHIIQKSLEADGIRKRSQAFLNDSSIKENMRASPDLHKLHNLMVPNVLRASFHSTGSDSSYYSDSSLNA